MPWLWSSPTSSGVQVCAGVPEGGVSACSGDSGGPLACPDQVRPERPALSTVRQDGNMYLAGIVSWGMIPCGQANRPSVYASVGHFR